jgi:hypothetical protein
VVITALAWCCGRGLPCSAYSPHTAAGAAGHACAAHTNAPVRTESVERSAAHGMHPQGLRGKSAARNAAFCGTAITSALTTISTAATLTEQPLLCLFQSLSARTPYVHKPVLAGHKKAVCSRLTQAGRPVPSFRPLGPRLSSPGQGHADMHRRIPHVLAP